MCGAFMEMCEAVAVSFGNMLKKCWSSGEYPSGHCMTTGFGPFELPNCGLLQRGQDHSPLKACFHLKSPALIWLSQRTEYTVAKQNGGGAEWVELLLGRV